MYIATKDRNLEGSTRLHLDVTNAINILVHESETDEGETPGAVWDLFDPADAEKLREYIWEQRKTNSDGGGQDPIHAQQTYLTEPMINELRCHGVRPFRVWQRLGEAVFIPAGWAHQVSFPRIICCGPTKK